MSKKSSKKSEKTTHYRDAQSGKYVTKKFADKHPKTTVKESGKYKSKETEDTSPRGTEDTGPRKNRK